MKRLLLLTAFVFALSACATHLPTQPAANAPYIEALQEIKALSPDQYLKLPNESIYIGEIIEGQANGFGKLITPDGSVYQGAINNGQPNGFGKSTMSSGEIYEGEHRNGIFDGRGRLTLSDGSTFIGTFKNHKVDRGEMIFPDGQRAIKR